MDPGGWLTVLNDAEVVVTAERGEGTHSVKIPLKGSITESGTVAPELFVDPNMTVVDLPQGWAIKTLITSLPPSQVSHGRAT